MSHREGATDYDRVIAKLGDKARVIECKDAWQWIVQDFNGCEWRSRHFCTSREGVLRRARERTQAGDPALEELGRLPERFQSVRKVRRRPASGLEVNLG